MPITYREWQLAREADELRRIEARRRLLTTLDAIQARNRAIQDAVAARIAETGESSGSLACSACDGVLTFAAKSYTLGSHIRHWTDIQCSTPACIGFGTPTLPRQEAMR